MIEHKPRMRQQDAPEGSKAGYIGDVETYEEHAGFSNTTPDLDSAEAHLAMAKAAERQAERDLEAARQADRAGDAAARAETPAALKKKPAPAGKRR